VIVRYHPAIWRKVQHYQKEKLHRPNLSRDLNDIVSRSLEAN